MKFLVAGLLLVGATNAFALNLQGYRFSDSYRYSLLHDSMKENFKGDYVISASTAYVKNPLYLSDSKASRRFSNIISYHHIGTLGYSHFITPTFSLGLDVNYIRNEVAGKEFSGLADTIVKGRWNVYQKSNYSFGINAQLYIPTGKEKAFTTTDSVGGAFNLVNEFTSQKWHFLVSGGYSNAKKNRYEIIDYRGLLLTQVGVSYDATETMNINLEAVNTYSTTDEHLQDEGDYYLTFKNKIKDSVSLYYGAGIAGFDKVNRDNYTFFLGAKISDL